MTKTHVSQYTACPHCGKEWVAVHAFCEHLQCPRCQRWHQPEPTGQEPPDNPYASPAEQGAAPALWKINRALGTLVAMIALAMPTGLAWLCLMAYSKGIPVERLIGPFRGWQGLLAASGFVTLPYIAFKILNARD